MPIKSIKPSYTEWVQEHNAAGTHSTINAQNIAVAGTASILSSVAASTLTTNMVKAAATQGLMLYDDAGTAGIFVQDGGNVGIGTTGPSYLVNMAKSADNGATVNDPIDATADGAILYLSNDTALSDSWTGIGFASRSNVRGVGDTWWLQSIHKAQDDVDFRIGWQDSGDASINTAVYIDSTGNVGIGTTGPLASLHADQSSTTGAKPVLTLDQADVDEEIIKFIATGAANLANTIAPVSAVTTATLYAYLRVNVQDDGNQIADQDYFMPLYTLV